MSTGESKQAYTVDNIKSELRQAVRQLSELSRSDASFDDFSQEVLATLVKLTGAHGALLWQVADSGGPRITHKLGQPNLRLDIDDNRHREVIGEVLEKQTPLALASESLRDAAQGQDEDATKCLLLFSPVYNRKRECCGSLELLQRVEISDSAQDGYLKFLTRIAELFQRWHEHHDLERLSQSADQQSATMDFISEIHRSIDFKETAFAIANETRRLLNCDRASFADWNGSRCKVVAVSSQDRFDNRANVIRKLGQVATCSVSGDIPLWITGDTEGLAPEIVGRINDYMDESHCRTLAVIPLILKPDETRELEFKPRQRTQPKKLGALIVEYFDADVPQAQVARQMQLIQNHAELASANAIEHQKIFLRPIWKRLGELNIFLFRNHYSKTMTALGVLAFTLLMLVVWPAELKMRVSGVIQPAIRRNIFAQTEGIVDDIQVDQGDKVVAGATLVKLVNPDLDIRIEETAGQLETTLKKIVETRTMSLSSNMQSEQEMEMSGRVVQLEAQRDNLQKRLELMHRKKAMQSIVSPIEGTVVTWDAKNRLTDLPISTNQLVLAVADMDGDWQAELRIPQNQVGYVIAAIEESNGEDLVVEFRLATDPTFLIQGKLVRLADRTDPGQSGVPEFRAIVDADVSQLKDLRPGAGLTAKIHCGRRSLGFVWFYQIIDFARTKVFF